MEKVKLTDKMRSYALEALSKFVICPLICWARENKGAFFFIVIGDENQADVAYYNTNALATYGAMAIAENPQTAAAFDDIEMSVDLVLEDKMKEEEFNDYLEKHSPSDDDEFWASYAEYDFNENNE